MKYPQIRNICDFGYYAFGKSKFAYEFTGFMLLANNIMLIGFHILTGAKSSIRDHLADGHPHIPSEDTTPRLVHVHGLRCVHGHGYPLISHIRGIEPAPLYGYNGDYPTDWKVRTYAFPLPGTTWVACMNAVLNTTFLWVPQILFPTFISEMEKPQDIPKSLAVLTTISAFLFIVPPAIGFRYLGQYSTQSPAFGSLGIVAYKKASFAFVIVPTLVIGIIYANVSAKFLYFRLLRGSHHAHSNTVLGWGVWVAIVAVIWIIAFIFAEVIPSMGDFLSLLGAAFDSFFGFVFFAVAYYQLYRSRLFAGLGRSVISVVHVFVMVVGLFLLGPGLYAAVKAILADYAGSTTPAFTCSNMSI
ncbi:hypothetical protein B0A55_02777 [Friedmanniomyces simplex]|uniref:Amino acid transporter transmembrane domain-containing protein n=1 Tax=Friedmanniomyces simplex TaxID=329884 RepID=A0A4U0XQK8_9PEZI|nr:hypothetical protein B0A55_02777 [Friedmanniomyces simplex]